MHYSLSLALGRPYVSGLDADAKAYVDAIVAAGATVTGTQRNAINDFVVAEKAASRWTGLKRFYLPVWGVAAANAICMKSLTSGTFVGGVTHGAGYVQGNGSTGYFDWGASPRTLGITESIGSFWGLVSAAPSTAMEIFRAIDSVQTGLFSNATAVIALLNDYATGYAEIGAATANQTGIFYSVRTNATNHITKVRRTAGVSAGSVNSATNSTNSSQANFYSFAVNVGGTPAGFSDQRMGSFGSATFSTVTDADDFTLNLKTLWETVTSLSLP